MTPHRPALVIFQGGVRQSPSPLQMMVVRAQEAAALDLLATAARSEAFEKALLVTSDPSLADAARAEATPSLPLTAESPAAGNFHFGQSLLAAVRSHGLERVVLVGGGAMPLGSARELRDLADAVGGDGESVTANNLYSADIIAFWPALALERIPLPRADNDLAWLLHYRAGLPFAPAPRILPFHFDIDTPSDLAVLWWVSQGPLSGGEAGPHLREALARVPSEMPRLAESIERAYTVMATRRAQVLVAGRVSSWVWRRLEADLPSQTRILSEERGMRASGREERGEVRSLLGLHADLTGPHGLMQSLEQVCDAAFLDSRILFAHRRLDVPQASRFASDALLPLEIADPWVRQFTEAAIASRLPVVLGGHSLVSGGVWALSERVRASASAGGIHKRI